MSLFDELLKNEEYRKLFEQLPDDERPVLMDSLRKFVDQVENSVILPLEKLKDST